MFKRAYAAGMAVLAMWFASPVPVAAQAPADRAAVAGLPGFTHHYAEVNGVRLHYVMGGSGPAVVLLHGWPYTWAEWQGVMPLLAGAGYTVIAPDMRGLGDSSRPDQPHLKRAVADDMHQLLGQLGLT